MDIFKELVAFDHDEDVRHAAELATLRAENERLRNMLERAKTLIPAYNWVWHDDVEEALK